MTSKHSLPVDLTNGTRRIRDDEFYDAIGGTTYGFQIDPKDIQKMLNNPDVDEFAERHSVVQAMLKGDVESGSKTFTGLLHTQAPWTKKFGISLHMNMLEGDSELTTFIPGIQYSKYDGHAYIDDLLGLFDLSSIQGHLTPYSFYMKLASEVNEKILKSTLKDFDKGYDHQNLTDLGRKIYYAVKYDITTVADVLKHNGYDYDTLWRYYFDEVII